MSDKTQKMHKSLIKVIIMQIIYNEKTSQALTVHALLPPLSIISAGMFALLFLDIYKHPALEKGIFIVSALAVFKRTFLCLTEKNTLVVL